MNCMIKMIVVGTVAAVSLSGCAATSAHPATTLKDVNSSASDCPRDPTTGRYEDDRAADVDAPNAAAGLAQLERLSRLTVSGTVVAVEDGVTDPAAPTSRYAVVTVRPDETFHGTAGREVRVVLMSDCVNGIHFHLAQQPIPSVGDTGLWFLRPAGPASGVGGYAPIGAGAEVLFSSTGRIANHGEEAALQAAEELGTRDQVLDIVRAAAGAE